MAAEVFADTAGWASAFVRAEKHHAQASAFLRQWQADGTTVVTTNYVLTEVAALLTSPLRVPRPQQIAILDTLRQLRWVKIVHVDEARDAAAFALFRQRPDKLWSIVDCASFIVMQERGISQAFTTDHHFEQSGFTCLLK